MSLWLLVLTACVFDRTDWVRERDDALCRLYVDCLHTATDRATCLADAEAFDEPDCPDFSAGAAQDCVDALRAQADACTVSDVADWEIPTVCAQVCGTTAAVARTLPNPLPPEDPTGGTP